MVASGNRNGTLRLWSPAEGKLVHTIVTNCLGGQVSLDSEPDEGTKISIIVPRVAPAAVPPS